MTAASVTAGTPAGTSDTVDVRSALLLSAGFGLGTGLAVFLIGVAGRLFRRGVYLDPQLIWRSVVAHTVIFLAFAVLVMVPALLWKRARSPRVLLMVFSSVAVYSLLLPVPRLDKNAALILSIGFGIQAGRMLAPRLASMRRLMARGVIAGGALVALAALVVNIVLHLRERRAYAALPQAGDSPNVVLIIWDTVRALSLSLYGYERPTTPFLEQLAGRSIVFDRAFATAPWTLPSHGSIFTGRWTSELSAGWRTPLDDHYPVIAEAMAANGYATAGFVANHTFGPPVHGLARGFTHYEYFPYSMGMVFESAPLVRRLIGRYNHYFNGYYSPHHRDAADMTGAFLDWQAKHTDRPFFAFLNLYDAHEPYLPPVPWRTRFGDPAHRRIQSETPPTPNEVRDLRDAQDGAIAYLDDQLRILFDELQRRGQLDHTIVVVASDHGELFGEHGLVDHGNSLYAPLLHVPLIIALPDGLEARVSHAISLRELPATLAELAALRSSRFPGRSLTRFWRPAAAADTTPEPLLAEVDVAPRQPAWYPLARGDMRAVLLWPWQYIRNGDGQEELYDLGSDPFGIADLAARDTATLRQLRAELARFPDR
jgi:arylsulfatase A-like enzyme